MNKSGFLERLDKCPTLVQCSIWDIVTDKEYMHLGKILRAISDRNSGHDVKINIEVKEKCQEAHDYLDSEKLKCVEVDNINRIVDALEEISDNLEQLTNCIGYVPPTPLQKEGYHVFRIGGCIDNGN